MLEQKIMLVEDNDLIRKMTRKAIEKKGYLVEEFNDGLYALNRLKELKDVKSHFDLILSDISMPYLDGISFSRECYNFTEIPVVLMTGDRPKNNFSKNVKEVLYKPVPLIEIGRVLKKYT